MDKKIADRPEFVTDEMLEFLDDLRESGVTNMFGARPFVAEEFGLDKTESAAVLTYWMETFPRAPSTLATRKAEA